MRQLVKTGFSSRVNQVNFSHFATFKPISKNEDKQLTTFLYFFLIERWFFIMQFDFYMTIVMISKFNGSLKNSKSDQNDQNFPIFHLDEF